MIKFIEKNNLSYIKTNANFIYINLGKKINYFYKKLYNDEILTKKGLGIKGYDKYLRVTIGPPKQINFIISKLKDLTKRKK